MIRSDKVRNLFKAKFTRDVLFTLASQVIMTAGGFVLNVVVAAYYDASGLGVFNQSLAVFMLIALVGDLGASNATLKYVSEYKDNIGEQNKIVSGSLTTSAGLSLCITAVVLLVSYVNDDFFYNKKATELITYNIIGLPFFIMNRILLAYLNGLRSMKLFSMGKSLRWLLILCFAMGFSVLGVPLAFIILSIPLAELFLFVFLMKCLKTYHPVRYSLNYPWLKKTFIFGSKTSLVAVINEGNQRTDILIASFFLSEAQIGIYSFAAGIAKGITMLAKIFTINFNPVISNLWAANKKEQLQAAIGKMRSYVSLYVLLLTALLAVIYPLILRYVVENPFFWSSIPCFYVILTGASLFSIFVFGTYLTMFGFPEIQLKIVVIVLIFNVFSMLILTNYYGLIGTATATSMLYLVRIFLNYYYVKKKSGINIIR